MKRALVSVIVLGACAAALAAGSDPRPPARAGFSVRRVPGGAAVGGEPKKLPALAPADEAATQARLDSLYQKLDGLQQEAVDSNGPGRTIVITGAGPIVRGRNAQEIDDLTSEILALRLGREMVARYSEYLDKSKDLQTQQQSVTADAGLDDATRRARLEELRTKRDALRDEYAEVLQEAGNTRATLQERQANAQRVLSLRTTLKFTAAEWKSLGAKIQAIGRLQEELQRLRQAPSPVVTVSAARWASLGSATPEGSLVKAVKADATPADLKAKLEALRKARSDEDARKQKQIKDLAAKLKAAQDELRALVTPAQEAVLVVQRILD